LARYYHKSELNKGVKPRPIHAALLKYGHNNFTLEILEYCSKNSLMVRENYYLRLLIPEYNILKYAYNLKSYELSAKIIAKQK
jgi:group I intron endonuclease